MDITTTDENGQVAPPLPNSEEAYGTQAIPWDDPYPYYKCMVPADSADTAVEDAFPLPDGR